MSRIPPEEGAPIPTETISGSATMSTLFRIMAHRPTIMQHAVQLLEATMRTGTVKSTLKELLAIRVSQVNHCFY